MSSYDLLRKHTRHVVSNVLKQQCVIFYRLRYLEWKLSHNADGIPIIHEINFNKTKWTGKNILRDIVCEVRSNIGKEINTEEPKWDGEVEGS